MSKSKNITLWIVAIVLMVIFVFYQRMTGPTYPVSGKVNINEQVIKFTLPRTHGGDGGEAVKLDIPDLSITGKITLKRFKSNDEWKTVDMQRFGNELLAELPHQPAAGKVIYIIKLYKDNKSYDLTAEPVIIRFKGDVPALWLIPHVVFIFLSFFFSLRTGLEAMFNGKRVYVLTIWTCVITLIGGLFLGPVIQKFAFDAFWTGWPFGHDLTDNKTLVAMIFWIIALFKVRKNPQAKLWVIIATVIHIIVFLIPHSVLGSEIDYTQMPKS